MDVRIPKSEWGLGPWQDEPDELAWTDERTGLPCRIFRNMHFGNFCGYVGVPPMHPYFGWSYDDDVAIKPGDLEDRTIDDMGMFEIVMYALGGGAKHGTIPLGMTLNAHRGINFSSGKFRGGDGFWWFGFDCGHFDDVSPAMDAMMHRFMPPEEREERKRLFDNKYRDIVYVKTECTALAFQLRQLETRVLVDGDVLKFIGAAK